LKKYFKISQKLRSKYFKALSGRIESLNLMFFTLKYIPISGEIVPLRSLWEEVGGTGDELVAMFDFEMDSRMSRTRRLPTSQNRIHRIYPRLNMIVPTTASSPMVVFDLTVPQNEIQGDFQRYKIAASVALISLRGLTRRFRHMSQQSSDTIQNIFKKIH
jgi:hypothetical protein